MVTLNPGAPVLPQNQRYGNSPFIIGVSGHRDLDPTDVASLHAAVSDFVGQLKQWLGATELRIIVGMADGADLLVAQAALDQGIGVEAVLPMPLARYASDFEPEALAVLTNLLKRPDVRCVELSPPVSAHPGYGSVDGPERDAMYENLALTLIRRSSILLALWDGNPSRMPGGTADTVLRYLGLRTEADPDAVAIQFIDAAADMDSADGLVYWVPAARLSSDLAAHAGLPCFLRGSGDTVIEMQRAMPARLTQQLAALDHYNREFQDLVNQGGLGPRDSLMRALPPAVPLHDKLMLEDIDAQYGKADSLAVHFQTRSDRLFTLFGVMAFAMGLAYLIYHNLTESRVLLVAYLIVLLSSLGVYHVLRGKHWFAKHLTYRAIAETMRVKFYLRLAGVDHRVDANDVLSLSGIDRFKGFGWISYVMRTIEPADVHAITPRAEELARLHFVEEAWIDNQHRYFTVKVASLGRSSGRIKRLRNALFVVILVVIVTLFLFGETLHHREIGMGISLKATLTFFMGFFAVLLGAWELHQNNMATRELLWQYQNQLGHFTRARTELGRMASLARRDEVLVQLGKDSLMESYLWTIHRYHREHEPPAST